MQKTKKTTKNKKMTKAPKLTRGLLAYHIAASLISIAPYSHTGRAIHHRHTSHGFLLVALILTGILLFNNLGALRANGLTSGGSQTVSVNVIGTPPTIGANITYPTTNTITKSPQIQVVGTCEPSTLVATYNNGISAGSSMCSVGGDYATVIQLIIGINILQSQDYDGLNQPGPVTSQVQITREQDPVPDISIDPKTPTIAKNPGDITANPRPPIVEPAPQPETNPCFDTTKIDTLNLSNPTIIVSCINRSIFAGDTMTLPVRIVGGTAPYALSVDWGDGLTDLKTVLDSKYHNYQHTYKTAGIIGVYLKTTDAKGLTSFLQTVVQVNGTASAGASTSNFSSIVSGLGSIWTEAPVPLYVAAVTLVLGFWVGDIFQRLFVKNNTGKGSRKPPTLRRQHRA
jgi:hypothetical protein